MVQTERETRFNNLRLGSEEDKKIDQVRKSFSLLTSTHLPSPRAISYAWNLYFELLLLKEELHGGNSDEIPGHAIELNNRSQGILHDAELAKTGEYFFRASTFEPIYKRNKTGELLSGLEGEELQRATKFCQAMLVPKKQLNFPRNTT